MGLATDVRLGLVGGHEARRGHDEGDSPTFVSVSPLDGPRPSQLVVSEVCVPRPPFREALLVIFFVPGHEFGSRVERALEEGRVPVQRLLQTQSVGCHPNTAGQSLATSIQVPQDDGGISSGGRRRMFVTR